MNREIKFRAWVQAAEDLGNDGLEITQEPYMAIQGTPDLETLKSFMHHYGDEKNLMQYTGLKDKNGTKIYEGDVLAYESCHPKHEGKVFNNVVEFAIGQSLCGWRMRNGKCVVKATRYKFLSSEIIGNIFEHPHLINHPL